MKKLNVIKLIFGLLFIIPILFIQCTKEREVGDIVLSSSMPFYNALNNKHEVDSVKLVISNNNAAEVVYYSSGLIKPYYSQLQIKNLALRGLYLEHLDYNRSLLLKLNSQLKYPKDADFTLFNSYLAKAGMPYLTLQEYNTNIKNTTKYFVTEMPQNIFNTSMFIIFMFLTLFIVSKFIYKNFIEERNLKEHVDDS